MAELKSTAHPDWPYAGTAHEWRGFAEKAKVNPWRGWEDILAELPYEAVPYQKLDFGPELT